jgi:hypothetical protein
MRWRSRWAPESSSARVRLCGPQAATWATCCTKEGTSTGAQAKMRSALVSAQVAGSLALLIIAGLFVRSFQRGQHAALGFDARNVLNVEIDPAEVGYSKTRGATFYDELLARVRALPDVQAASLAMAVPIGDNNRDDRIEVPGYTPRPGEEASVDYNAVSPKYLRTMR